MAHRLAYSQVVSLVMNSLYLEWDEEAGERVAAGLLLCCRHFTLEARMGELNFGEAQIEDFGDSVSDKNTDASEETVDENGKLIDENDKLEDFPAEVAGWPDPDFPPPGP